MASEPRSARWALAAAAPALLLGLLLFVAPLGLLVRVSLYAGGGRSGFGIGGGGYYRPGTWTLDAYRGLFADGYFLDVARFTVLFALAVATISTLLAYPLALGIARLRGAARLAALAAVALPKLANVLVVVYGLELLLGASGPPSRALQALGLRDEPLILLHDLTGTLIGKTYLILPYAVLVLVVAFERIDGTLVAAARGLGAGPLAAFRRVTLPLSLPGVGLAFFLSLAFGLGAFVTPWLMGSPDQITLAVDVQRQAFENLAWPRAAAEAVVVLVLLSAVAAGAAAVGRSARGARA